MVEKDKGRKVGERPSRNTYKEYMDKAKGGRFKRGRQGGVEWGCNVREEFETTLFEQQ